MAVRLICDKCGAEEVVLHSMSTTNVGIYILTKGKDGKSLWRSHLCLKCLEILMGTMTSVIELGP
jgi:hypothetical protein